MRKNKKKGIEPGSFFHDVTVLQITKLLKCLLKLTLITESWI